MGRSNSTNARSTSDFARELAAGKPNSLGNTLNVVRTVAGEPKRFPQLLALLLHPEPLVAMRAMNATKRLMRGDSAFFHPHRGSLVTEYSKTKHNVVKLGLITLYFDFINEFTPTEVRRIKVLTLRWVSEAIDWMILVQGLKLLEKLAKLDPAFEPKVLAVAKRLRNDSRKAVSTKAKGIISRL
jgi:hypothetical protein